MWVLDFRIEIYVNVTFRGAGDTVEARGWGRDRLTDSGDSSPGSVTLQQQSGCRFLVVARNATDLSSSTPEAIRWI